MIKKLVCFMISIFISASYGMEDFCTYPDEVPKSHLILTFQKENNIEWQNELKKSYEFMLCKDIAYFLKNQKKMQIIQSWESRDCNSINYLLYSTQTALSEFFIFLKVYL